MRKFFTKPGSRKIYFFLLVVFLWIAADTIFAYTLPVIVEDRFDDLALVGLLISLGAVVGIVVDLLAGSKLVGSNYSFFIISGLVTSLLVAVLYRFEHPVFSVLMIFTGGVYSELLNFGREGFLSKEFKKEEHTKMAGLLVMVGSVAALGVPLFVTDAIEKASFHVPFIMFAVLMLLALVTFVFLKPKPEEQKKVKFLHPISIVTELKIWEKLSEKTAYILVMMIMVSVIDAVFWTTGALLAIELISQNEAAKFLIPVFILPGLFAPFYTPKLSKLFGEKRALILSFMLMGGFLIGFNFTDNVFVILILTALSSTFISSTYTLIEGTLAHLINRLREDGNHMISLRGMTADIGYIIGPILAGLIASQLGLKEGYVVIGILIVLIGIVLMIFTQRDIRLPRKEIDCLENEAG
ncbi:MAG: MFS transporter [Candidatus Dojkabacteria bacterium]